MLSLRSALPSEPLRKEVRAVLKRLLRILSAKLDVDRIDANRDAVAREVSLRVPLR